MTVYKEHLGAGSPLPDSREQGCLFRPTRRAFERAAGDGIDVTRRLSPPERTRGFELSQLRRAGCSRRASDLFAPAYRQYGFFSNAPDPSSGWAQLRTRGALKMHLARWSSAPHLPDSSLEKKIPSANV